MLQHPVALILLAVVPLLAFAAMRLAPRIGRARAWTSAGIRSLLVGLLALALAQPLLPQGSRNVTVAVILDRSRSVSEPALDSAVQWVQEALQGQERQSEDRVALVHVAAEAIPGAMPSPEAQVSLDIPPGLRDASSLAGGIELARAMLPQDTRNRLLLISDGLDTEGTLSAAHSSDTPIDVLVLPVDRPRDVRIERISAPARAPEGGVIEMDLVVHAAAPASGRIVIRRNGTPVPLGPDQQVQGLSLTLPKGTTVLPLQVVAGEALTRLEASWIPDVRQGDAPENDHGRAIVLSAQTGRVLLVGTDERALEGMLSSLAGSGIDAKIGTPADLAQGAASLASIDALVLVDLPRWALPTRFDTLLARWVESSGGGLLMTGGHQALGAGGWIGSDVEGVLPVDLEPPAQRQIQRGALVLLMHSCEMERGNHWGRVICETAIEALSSADLVGIIEYNPSSGRPHWPLDLAPAGDKVAALQAAARLTFGDMPDFAPSMEDAVAALEAADAGQKHIVIVSDGDPQPPSVDLLERMRSADIAATTVLVGGHGRAEDTLRMERIARFTGGEFHDVRDASQLPGIMIEAAQLATRSLVQEEVAPVATTSAAPGPLKGITLPPPIDAWVVTAPRDAPAATPWVVKGTQGDDPLVAWWHRGSGRSVVVTVPPAAGWTPQWNNWGDRDRFWQALVSWLRPTPDEGEWALQARQGEGPRVEVTLEAANEATQDVLPVTRSVVLAPDGSTRMLDLRPTGPGRATGGFVMDQPGEWVVASAVEGTDGAGPIQLRAALAQAWPDEDRASVADTAAMHRLAQATGGRVHALDGDPLEAALFDRTGLDVLVAPSPLWPWLVIAAAILLPIDVAVRRLVLKTQEGTMITVAPTPRAQATSSDGSPSPSTPRAADRAATSTNQPPASSESKPVASDRVDDPSGASEQADESNAMDRLRAARRRGRGQEEDLS
ncbi:MAG: hypothetical protein MK101_02985 [Phycisphaerales bacterium]|nr:hypothetical protein [Phycisphaerales bacterium]